MNPKTSIISLIGTVFCISCGEQVKMHTAKANKQALEHKQVESLTTEKAIFDFQVVSNTTVLDKQQETSLELEKSIERAILEDETISIAISIYTFDEDTQEPLNLTRVPRVLDHL